MAKVSVGLVAPLLVNCSTPPVMSFVPAPLLAKTKEFNTKGDAVSLFAVKTPFRTPVKVTVALLALTGLFGIQSGPLVQVTVPLVVLLVTVGTKTTGAAVMTTSCVAEFPL